jgi:hypothetical protein
MTKPLMQTTKPRASTKQPKTPPEIAKLMRGIRARYRAPSLSMTVRCVNGPFQGFSLYLTGSTGSIGPSGLRTLPFTVRGESGFYVAGLWVPSK